MHIRTVTLCLTLLLCPLPTWATSPPAEGEATRHIPVTLVTDKAFRTVPNWRGMVRGAMEMATEDLAELAGLTFRDSEEVSWEPPSEVVSLEQTLDAAMESVGPRDGLIAVFLGQRPRSVPPSDDKAFAYLGRPGLILVAPSYSDAGFGVNFKRHVSMLFRHELGHVFGVPHRLGKSIMNIQPREREFDFDELDIEILRANRTMEMDATYAFTGSDLELLRDVYLILDDRGEMEAALLTKTAIASYQARHFQDARLLFERALRRDRHSSSALLGMAQTTVVLGDTSTAIRITTELMELDPLTPSMKGAIGGIWLKIREYELAEAFLDEAIAEGPPRFSTVFNRGLLRFRQDRYPEAKADFEHALTISERPEGWYNLGLTCDALDQKPESAAAFTRYLELAPDGRMAEEATRFLERTKGTR